MNRTFTAILIVVIALGVFAGLIWMKMNKDKKDKPTKIADITALTQQIKSDSLYMVKQVLYKDSGIFIAVANPDKSGTENHFDSKYKLNTFDNINMVYVFQYDSTHPLEKASPDDALMAKGKKLGSFQQDWVAKFIDTLDGSCKPLKKYLTDSLKIKGSLNSEETQYQPESIHRMRVLWKYKIKDSAGVKPIAQVSAVVDTAGRVLSAEKN